MKLSSLFVGLGMSLGFMAVANAKVVNGTANGYFATVYATDLAGQTYLHQYDEACKSKYWYLVNTAFGADYRVNTDSATHTAFFRYANAEHTMTGVYSSTYGSYVFKTSQLTQSLKDMHAKEFQLAVTNDFRWATAKLVFEPTQVSALTTHDDGKTDCPPDCGCACHKQEPKTSYQCVLST